MLKTVSVFFNSGKIKKLKINNFILRKRKATTFSFTSPIPASKQVY